MRGSESWRMVSNKTWVSHFNNYHLVIYHSHGKSPFLIGKPSINGPFSMAMLNNQRVNNMKQSWLSPSRVHVSIPGQRYSPQRIQKTQCAETESGSLDPRFVSVCHLKMVCVPRIYSSTNTFAVAFLCKMQSLSIIFHHVSLKPRLCSSHQVEFS